MDDIKASLSKREQEVLCLLATGASNKEIAARLVISPNTVKVHLRNIYAKIEVGSRTEAIMWALQHGLVDVESQGISDAQSPADAAPEARVAAEVQETADVQQAAPAAPRRLWWILAMAMLALALVAGGIMGSALLKPQRTPAQSPQVVAGEELTRWQEQPPLPVSRWGMIPVVYANRIYLFGGQDSSQAFQDGYFLRPNETTWEALPPAPQPFTGGCAALLGEKIYLVGGLRASGEVHAQVQVFNPLQGTWESAASLPVPLSRCALTAYEGRLYLFGGWDGKSYLDIALRYDPQDDQWSALPPLRVPRADASAVVTTVGIHLLGGQNAEGTLSSHELYLPYRQTTAGAPWQPLLDVPASGTQVRATVIADLLHVFVLDEDTAQGWVFNATENVWQPIEAPPQSPGMDTAIVSLGTYIHFLGGRRGNATLSSHWTYRAVFITAIPVIIQ